MEAPAVADVPKPLKPPKLPRNVIRIVRGCELNGIVQPRFGVKVKVFGKQVRVGSRFADVESADTVAQVRLLLGGYG